MFDVNYFMFWIAFGVIGIIVMLIAIRSGLTIQIAPLWKACVDEGCGVYVADHDGTRFFHWYTSLDINAMPTMTLSFSSFKTIYQAAPQKIILTQLREDSIEPSVILYDQDGDGKADVRILMASRKEACACWRWIYDLLTELREREAERKEVQDTLTLLESAQSMQTDIKRSTAAHHENIMALTEENRRWREAALERQEKMQGGNWNV